MLCDTDGCGAEATVHETLIRNGKKVERHLCEKCARKQGIVFQTPVPINELLSKIVMSQGLREPSAKPGTCPGCAMTWAKFRQQGLLGCAECYRTFEKELLPLVSRAHEGGEQHVGKTPRRAGSRSEILQGRLAALRQQLQEAVAAEQYERAAALRDQLREIADQSPDDEESEP